jgi:hypothetical protein
VNAMQRFLYRFWLWRWVVCSRRMRAKGSSCVGWRDHMNGNDGSRPL